MLFDASGDFVIRTPKRPGGYAAQLWGRHGFWLLGAFPTIRAARGAAREFAALDPAEPVPGTPRAAVPAGWHWRRSDSHAPRYNCVRRVKGGAWQARPWLGAGRGSLNLGLFTVADHGDLAEWAAAQVSKAFNREWRAGRTVAEVVEALKRAPRRCERVPEHVEVPPHQRGLTPAAPARGETAAEQRARRARERAERRERAYPVDLFGAVAA